MTWTGVAIGTGVAASGVLSYLGSSQAASGAQATAEAQLSQAQANQQKALGFAQATPQELNMLSQTYSSAMANLNRQQQLMDSIDPSLMAASKQALSILQGGTAQMNNPLMAQRNSQRSQLMDQLKSTYGPGAELSSAGRQALSQFDMDTNSMFQANQTNSLSQLTGIANNGMASGNQNNLAAMSPFNSLASMYGNIQSRQTNAAIGTGTELYNSAGANNVQQTLQGQGMASLGGNLMNAGVSLATSMYGKSGNVNNYYGGGGGGDPTAGWTPGGLTQPTLGASASSGNPSWFYGNPG